PSSRSPDPTVQARELATRQLRTSGILPRRSLEEVLADFDVQPAQQHDEFDATDDDDVHDAARQSAVRRRVAESEIRRRLADRVPPVLRAARSRVGRSAALGALAVGFLVVVVLGVMAWRSWPARSSTVESSIAGSAVAQRVSTTPASTPASMPAPTASGEPVPVSASSSTTPVVVHVAGHVVSPGLVTLSAGSRVADAVAAAGGPAPDADLNALNLARLLVDGDQVVVPAPGELFPPAPVAPAGASVAPDSGPVDLNSATVEELDALPGVGEVLAGRIVAFRTENGPFSAVEDLGEVQGIGPKVLEGLRDLVRV
ncbi:MAG: ComEA family DNA-binding protein, partial [Janthinobacterium lividum]